MKALQRLSIIALLFLSLSLIVILCTPANSGDNSALIADGQEASTPAPPDASPTATPVPSPTEIPPPPTPTPEPVRTARLSFSGDVLSHSGVYNQARRNGEAELATSANQDGAAPAQTTLAYDYRPMFQLVQERLQAADLALCVLETPVSEDNSGLSGYPVFNAPRELPDSLLAVGFDGCSTASNHSYDRGPAGVTTTLDEMDRVGLGHAGMARSFDEQQTPRMYDVNGIKIAHLSWTYGLNGFVLPADQPWLVNVTDPDAVLADAARARAAGADIVVLSIQWGDEYRVSPNDTQLELAEILTASPNIDIIAGNHVHVVQPIGTVNDKPVIYGLGNFLSNQSSECCPVNSQDGVMVEVTVTGKESEGYVIESVVIVPTWVDRTDYTIVPVVSALTDPDITDAQRTIYETSLARTLEAINSLGASIGAE